MNERGWRASSPTASCIAAQDDRHDVAAERPARRPPAVADDALVRAVRRRRRAPMSCVEAHEAGTIDCSDVLAALRHRRHAAAQGGRRPPRRDPRRDPARLPRARARAARRSRPPGRTDPWIARAILLQLGVSAERIDDGMLDFKRVAVEEYARRCRADLSRARRARACASCSSDLRDRDDVVLSLVTGNLERDRAAQARARRASASSSRAAQGGFGSDHEDRTELPAIARARAGRNGDAVPARGHGRHRRHAARHRVRARRRRALHRGHAPARSGADDARATPTRSSARRASSPALLAGP